MRYLLNFILFFFFSFTILFASTDNNVEVKNEGVFPVNYEKNGKFSDIGGVKFNYKITNLENYKKEAGDYVYPNLTVPKELQEKYKKMYTEGKIRKNDIWSHVNSGDSLADLLAWVSIKTVEGNFAEQGDGIRQFMLGDLLRSIGEYQLAIKAYYAVVLHFPKTFCWTSDGSFVWYVGPAALDRINLVTREHPEIGYKLEGAYIEVENGNDVNFDNDIIRVNPGKFIKIETKSPLNLSKLDIIKEKGKGKVRLVQYSNKHWQLLVNNKPTVVHGVTYSPTLIGLAGQDQNKWMFTDTNKNRIIDAAYESWVDLNKNNIQDPNEKAVGDFTLLKEMGANAIRMYHSKSASEYVSDEFDKKILRDMYNKYGISVIMGDFLGAYGIGSGGNFTDYKSRAQKDMMKECVRKMVLDHKDEPYIMMWILGNENDMPSVSEGVNYTNTNARKCPDDYVLFVNEVVDMIHSLDPNHPVIVANMTQDMIPYYVKHKTNMDIFGINLYMGKYGFGTIWKDVNRKLDVPVLITEYGCDAYYEGKGLNEEDQADYHKGNWKDIEFNFAGGEGVGNSVGGILFEWLDEWWKAGGNNFEHEIIPQSSMPFSDGWAHEEWFGIVGQGDGTKSPFLRDLRKAYYVYKDELWNKK